MTSAKNNVEIEIAEICGIKYRFAPDGSVEILWEWAELEEVRPASWEPFDPLNQEGDVVYAMAKLGKKHGKTGRRFVKYFCESLGLPYPMTDFEKYLKAVRSTSPLELSKTILRFDATAWREDLWRMVQSGYSREEYAATQQRLEAEEAIRLKRIEALRGHAVSE